MPATQAISLADPSLHSDTAGGPSGAPEEFSPLTGARAVSADGRYVAFVSKATNLVAGQVDTNRPVFGEYASAGDVFVRDRVLGTTRLVSGVNGSATHTGDGNSSDPSISADGRYIAFLSNSSNLVPGQVDEFSTDAFVFDQLTGTTRLVSGTGGSATLAVHGINSARISGNGQFVVFETYDDNVVPGQVDPTFSRDVFVFDCVAGTTRLVSGADGSTTHTGKGESSLPTISHDGGFIAFRSEASDLVPGLDGNGFMDVYVFDRDDGDLRLVTGGDNASDGPVISADGRYIAYTSLASDLFVGQQDSIDPSHDAFLFDRVSGDTELVSGTNGSALLGGHSVDFYLAISGDGRYVAFASADADLVLGLDDDNDALDVFVFDRVENETRLASGGDGSASHTTPGTSRYPSISGDGRYVAFASDSTTLVPDQNDLNEGDDVFVFDREGGTLRLVSGVGGSLTTADDDVSDGPLISADGTFICFRTDADDLVPALLDANQYADTILFGVVGGTPEIVSRSATPSGTAGGSSFNSDITPDGRYAVFISNAVNLVPGQVDVNGTNDVFLYDRVEGTLRLVSGVGGSATLTANGESYPAGVAISADGRFVVFTSFSTDLVPGQVDTPGTADVFVFDRVLGSTRLVSGANGSTTAAVGGDRASISSNGGYITFVSFAPNVVAGQVDQNDAGDVFVFDRAAGTTRLASGAAGVATVTADGNSFDPVISADGRYIAFSSDSVGLVLNQNDDNDSPDVFVFDRVAGTTRLVSGVNGSTTQTGDWHSQDVTISADGQFIAFRSGASDLAPGQADANDTNDVFVFDRITGTTRLVSRAAGTNAVASNGSSDQPRISADGRFIAFRSGGTNLVPGQVEIFAASPEDIFVYDRVAGTTRLVSGVRGSLTNAGSFAGEGLSISADGRFITFVSLASELVIGQDDPYPTADRFVFDRLTGQTQLITGMAGSATVATGGSFDAVISDDGSTVLFTGGSAFLVSGDHNGWPDVFLYDVDTSAPQLHAPMVSAATTNEDVRTTAGLVITPNPADGSLVTHYKVTALTNGSLFLPNGTPVSSGVFLTAAQGAAGLRFQPAANFSGTATFQVFPSASGDEAGVGPNAATATITVTPVADLPTLTAPATLRGREGAIALPITAALKDTDGSETLAVRISGVPAGATLNHGVNAGAGVWNLTAADLSGLTLTPADNGTFNLTVRATATETDSRTVTVTKALRLIVSNVAPTPLITGLPATSPQGTPIALTASATDPSPADTTAGFAYSWSVTNAARRLLFAGRGPAFTFTPLVPGVYTVRLQAMDRSRGVGSVTATVQVTNVAPNSLTLTLPSGTLHENETATLDVAFADPGTSDRHTVLVDWGDGSTTIRALRAGARSLLGLTHRYLDNPSGGPTFPITVTVRDQAGDSVTGSTTITVLDTAPTAMLTVPTSMVRGQPRPFTLGATDVSTADQAAGFTWQIDWGDGQTEPATGASGLQVEHVYAEAGTFTVQVVATDKDGGASAAVTKSVTVGTVQLQSGVLAFGGTAGNDVMRVVPGATAGTVAAVLGDVTLGTFAGVKRIAVFGQGGDDDIQVGSAVKTVAALYGGTGADTLTGGGGATILDGGADGDTLTGGVGRSVLIGGAGADRLSGKGGDDLIVAGTVARETALDAVFGQWLGTLTYGRRVSVMRASLTAKVADDAAADELTGAAGLDWFFGRLEGGVVDPLTDRIAAEVVTPL